MSFLKELRESQDESLNAKPLVNNEKNTKDDQPDEVNKVNNTERDVTNPGDAGEIVQQDLSVNDDHEELMKLKSIAKVEEVRNILENEKSMEANNPLIKLILKDAERNTGVSFEAYSNRKELLRAIGKWNVSVEASKVSVIGALKDAIRDGWASFVGYNYFKEVYNHEIYNKVKGDLLADVVKAVEELDKSDVADDIDKSINAASKQISREDAVYIYNNGKLIDSADLSNTILATIKDLINLVPSSGELKSDKVADEFYALKVDKIIEKIPNTVLIRSNDDVGVGLKVAKTGSFGWKEYRDWVIKTDNIVYDYAAELRKLESELAKRIKAMKSNKDGITPDAYAFTAAITQTCLFLAGLFNAHVVKMATISTNIVTDSIRKGKYNIDADGVIEDLGNAADTAASKGYRILVTWLKHFFINVPLAAVIGIWMPGVGSVLWLLSGINATGKTIGIVLESNREQYLKDLNQIKGAMALMDLDRLLTKSPSLESNNALIKAHLDMIESQYGVSLEDDNEGKSLKERIRDKITSIGKKIKEWGEIIDDKFSGLDKVSGYLAKLKEMDAEQQKAFMERFNGKEYKYLTESGKLVLPNDLVKQIRDFDATLANGMQKMFRKVTADAKKVFTYDNKDDEVYNVLKDATKASGLVGKVLKVPNIKMEIISHNRDGQENIGIDFHHVVSRSKIKSSNDFKTVVKYLEQVNEGWQAFRKLSKENRNTWKKLSNMLHGEFENENQGFIHGKKFDLYSEMSFALLMSSHNIGTAFKLIKSHFSTTVGMIGSSLPKSK